MAISSDWLILPAQAGTMAVWTSLRSRRHQTRICSGHTDAGNWWAPPAVHTRRHEARDSSRPTHWDNGNRTYDVLSSFSRSTVIIIVDLQTSHRGSTLSLAFTMGSSCIQSKDSHTSKPWNPRWLLFAASPVVFFSISFMATSWVALRSIRFASLPGTSTWFKALNESKRPKCLCQKKHAPIHLLSSQSSHSVIPIHTSTNQIQPGKGHQSVAHVSFKSTLASVGDTTPKRRILTCLVELEYVGIILALSSSIWFKCCFACYPCKFCGVSEQSVRWRSVRSWTLKVSVRLLVSTPKDSWLFLAEGIFPASACHWIQIGCHAYHREQSCRHPLTACVQR